MPRPRISPEEKENRMIVAKIEYGKKMCKVENADLTRLLSMTRRTFYTRMVHPEKFTLEELRIVSRRLQIPLTDLISDKVSLA